MSSCALAGLALLASVLAGCGEPDLAASALPAPQPPTAPAPAKLQRLEIRPESTVVAPGDSQAFTAQGVFTDGTTRPRAVWFSATGGTISAGGTYVAGPSGGRFHAVATDRDSGLSDSAAVEVRLPVEVAAGYSDDFSRYQNDDEVRAAYSTPERRIWNFSGTDWSAVGLVDDAVFGKALRVTLRRQDPFFDLVKAPSGLPGAVQRLRINFTEGPMPAVWVRFFVKFAGSPDSPYGWRTKSPNDPSPFGGSYKVFFLHWAAPYSERGSLVYTNTFRLDAEFYVSGLAKVQQAPAPGSGPAHNLASGNGTEWNDGEWYEMLYLYRVTGGRTARAGAWVRRYTRGNQPAPGPFRWWMSDTEFAGSPPLASSMELGGNKNHGNEFDQYVIWGPWSVVDADAHPNPFGVPMVP